MISKCIGATLVAATMVALGLSDPATSQRYPNRPIKIVVSTVAGTTPDIVARLVAEQLAVKLGQGVVVDNRPGASHSIALKFVATAEPDGYTLLLGATGSLTINPALRHGTDFTNLEPVALLATTPNVMVVSSGVSVKTFSELVAYAWFRIRPEGEEQLADARDNHLQLVEGHAAAG